MSNQRYTSFKEFWPFYMAEHSKPGTRWLHLIGTVLAAADDLLRCVRTLVAVPFRTHPRLRRGVVCAFCDRKKPTSNVSISALVVHGRLQNDRPHAYRTDR